MNDFMSLPHHHPTDATLLSFATGALSAAHSCPIEVHAAGCSDCREAIAMMDRLGGIFLDDLTPTRLDGDQERPLRQPKSGHTTSFRTPPLMDATSVAKHLSSKRMKWLGPGIRHLTLAKNPDGTLHLVKVKAGVALPHHAHRGLELTAVLSGAFRDGQNHYREGDVSEVDEESAHAPVAEGPGDCVCLIATEGGLHFSGLIARLLRPLLPF